MPFISKDWRSPGEEWVKTQEGWEKKKVLECTAQRYPAINFNNSDDNQQKSCTHIKNLAIHADIQLKPYGIGTIVDELSLQYGMDRIKTHLFDIWPKDFNGWINRQTFVEAQHDSVVAKIKATILPIINQYLATVAPSKLEGEDGDKNSSDAIVRVPPHCHITIKCTREIAGFNGLSEAVRRLDFSSAVRDVRRFNYICALLELLLGGQKLTHLPGAAQKLLLSMLEQLADQVATSKQNLNALRALLVALQSVRDSERRACWGRPLGSRALWGHHDHAIARINQIADAIRIQEPGPEVAPKLHDMPEECIREILLRVSDHRDLDAASSAWNVMASVCSEQRIWRELVHFHFTQQQIEALQQKEKDQDVDWKKVFHQLRKLYGLREDAQYAEMLSLCRHCKCLFWRSLGHPCIADQCPEYRERLKEAGGPLPPYPVPPAAFLKFFSL